MRGLASTNCSIASVIMRLWRLRSFGSDKSRSKIAPKVWRFETRKKQNALIIRCTSTGSRSLRNSPCLRPRSRMSVKRADDAGVHLLDRLHARQMPRSMNILDAHQADEMRMGLVVVERELDQLPQRFARLEVREIRAAIRACGCRSTPSRARPDTALPCRRSSNRSCAWTCACVRRSDRLARRSIH